MKKCYLVDKETGDIIEENYNYFEQKDRERMKIFTEKKVKKEIFHEYQDEYLGKFVFLFFDNLKALTSVLNDTDLVAFMYIGTYTKNDASLRLDNNKTFIDKKMLKNMLNMKKSKFSEFWNKLIDNKLIIYNDDRIYINLLYFYRGQEKEYKKITNKKLSGEFTRLYIETTRNLYKNTPSKSLKKYSVVYKLLPYVNWRYNILCENIYEDDKSRLKLLTIEDIAKYSGYNTSNLRKLKKDLFSLKYKEMSIFGRFNDTASPKNDMILINPLFYHRGSDLSELNFLANLFGISAKRNIDI